MCLRSWGRAEFRRRRRLGVTLDRTLSYRVHLTKTAGKVKNRNNLLMKLAGSSMWRQRLRSFALRRRVCQITVMELQLNWRLVTVEIVKVEIESVRVKIIADFDCLDFDCPVQISNVQILSVQILTVQIWTVQISTVQILTVQILSGHRVTLNMPSAAEKCREPSGKCQEIVRVFHIVWRVVSCVWKTSYWKTKVYSNTVDIKETRVTKSILVLQDSTENWLNYRALFHWWLCVRFLSLWL